MKTNWDGNMPREDHLDDYVKLSAEQILEWLEKANRSVKQLLSPKSRNIKEKLRQG